MKSTHFGMLNYVIKIKKNKLCLIPQLKGACFRVNLDQTHRFSDL